MNAFVHNNRNSMTPQRKARLFMKLGMRCAHCTRKLTSKDRPELDHIHALEKGGSDEDDNFQVLCQVCHGVKTKGDHKEAGHIRRSATKHVLHSDDLRSNSWGRGKR